MDKQQSKLAVNFSFNFAMPLRSGSALLAVLVCSFLIWLGLWQLDRAVYKQERLNRISELKTGKRINISDLPALADERQDLPISMTGKIVQGQNWYIENMIVDGVLGVDLIVLFELADSGKFVFINLGWQPVNLQRQPMVEHVFITSEQISIEGMVRNYDENRFMSDELVNASWGSSFQQLNPKKLANSLNVESFDFVILINSEQELAHKTHWQAVVMSPEKHRAYAVQWFLLAGCFFILMLWWDRYHAREK